MVMSIDNLDQILFIEVTNSRPPTQTAKKYNDMIFWFGLEYDKIVWLATMKALLTWCLEMIFANLKNLKRYNFTLFVHIVCLSFADLWTINKPNWCTNWPNQPTSCHTLHLLHRKQIIMVVSGGRMKISRHIRLR